MIDKTILVLPGDGIGPEVIAEAVKVLKVVAQKFSHNFHFNYGLIGAEAIEITGEPYPEETHQKALLSDAILFGAIGHPKYDNNPKAKVRPEQGLLKMRKELGLFANIRPIELYSTLAHYSPLKRHIVEGVDLIIVRELTGGLYFGEPRGRRDGGKTAFETSIYTTDEIERVSHIAFKMALEREQKVTLVDKANVLESSKLWREVVTKLQREHYPEITLDYLYVDNAAMQLVSTPSTFDVLLTENMFGDILSDLASLLTGSIGVLPSASLGKGVPLFEPIHGSYPQAAGQNRANPIGTILSAAMMLNEAFALKRESQLIRKAVAEVVNEGYLTSDLSHLSEAKSTSQVGDRIAEKIKRD